MAVITTQCIYSLIFNLKALKRRYDLLFCVYGSCFRKLARRQRLQTNEFSGEHDPPAYQGESRDKQAGQSS